MHTSSTRLFVTNFNENEQGKNEELVRPDDDLTDMSNQYNFQCYTVE